MWVRAEMLIWFQKRKPKPTAYGTIVSPIRDRGHDGRFLVCISRIPTAIVVIFFVLLHM